MSKRTGSYASLIRGVSEQVPHDRLPGQFWAQDNMISDPVRGLARRRGSVMLQEAASAAEWTAATRSDAGAFTEQSLSIQGIQYSLAFRKGFRPSGSTCPGIVGFNKSAGALLSVVAQADDATAQALIERGISSATAVGDFVLFSGANTSTTYLTTDMVEIHGLESMVWVKGGDYSRTYTVRLHYPNSTSLSVSYTTPASNYEGVLDTSDILTSDPDYQKKVNDRVHAYNTAVNQWIASAKAAIAPNAIAEQLRLLLVAAGQATTRVGSHLFIRNPDVVTVDDGGNGEFIKAVSREVESTADLTLLHIAGKVVKIVPKEEAFNNAAYYLRAEPKVAGSIGIQEVTWVESPGIRITPNFVFLMGYIRDNILYVASSSTRLEALAGITSAPRYPNSVAGDEFSQPVPFFMGRKISYINTIQDRLMIVSGATAFFSRPGDYFNFFRETALSVLPNDPIEVFARGSEGDTISSSMQLDRNLLLFGNQHQYAVPAREALTPTSAFIGIQGSYENSNLCPPTTSGSLGFFAQQRDRRLTMQQLTPGSYADSLQANDLTKQLDGYMTGRPRQLLAVTSPDMVFVRSSGLFNGLFVYSYLDSPQGRLYDSWSKWTWSTHLGVLVSITEHQGVLQALYLRNSSSGVKLVLDKFSLEAGLDDSPYLDSRRMVGTVGTIGPDQPGAAETSVAITTGSEDHAWIGTGMDRYADFLVDYVDDVAHMQVGTNYLATATPTAPYIRDELDRAILDGRLTLTSMKVTVSDSAAMRAFVSPIKGTGEEKVLDWIYRPAGAFVLNTQQIADIETLSVFVMKEVRDFKLRFESRNWLPLTISSIEWAGQFFTQRRR